MSYLQEADCDSSILCRSPVFHAEQEPLMYRMELHGIISCKIMRNFSRISNPSCRLLNNATYSRRANPGNVTSDWTIDIPRAFRTLQDGYYLIISPEAAFLRGDYATIKMDIWGTSFNSHSPMIRYDWPFSSKGMRGRKMDMHAKRAL